MRIKSDWVLQCPVIHMRVSYKRGKELPPACQSTMNNLARLRDVVTSLFKLNPLFRYVSPLWQRRASATSALCCGGWKSSRDGSNSNGGGEYAAGSIFAVARYYILFIPHQTSPVMRISLIIYDIYNIYVYIYITYIQVYIYINIYIQIYFLYLSSSHNATLSLLYAQTHPITV